VCAVPLFFHLPGEKGFCFSNWHVFLDAGFLSDGCIGAMAFESGGWCECKE